MKHTGSDNQKQQEIEEIVSFLNTSGKGILFAYLFGSFVTSKQFSDIDIGIYLEQDVVNAMDLEFDLENGLEARLHTPVDIRILNSAPISFCQNVIRKGKVILDKNPDERAFFQGLILKKYFDFEPFRRRYLREVVNAPI